MSDTDSPSQVSPLPAGCCRIRERALVLLSIIALAGLYALWPGDVGLGGDGAQLISLALDANTAGHPATMGLLGTHDLHYGPTPVWFYQVLLLLTHDLPALVALRAALFTMGTGIALLWLGSSLRWRTWLIPMLLLPPYFWNAARAVWDNNLAIPLGSLLLAAYASWLVRPRGWKLPLVIVTSVLLALLHLMTLPLLLALAIHAMLWQHRAAAKQWFWVAGGIVLAAALSWPYLQTLATEWPGRPPGIPHRTGALVLAADSGRLFSAAGLASIVGDQWAADRLQAVAFASAITSVALVLSWAGYILVMAQLWKSRADRPLPQTHFGIILLLAPVIQTVLFQIKGIPPYLHYNHGLWAVYACLIWFAADYITQRLRWSIPIFLLHIAALSLVTGTLACRAHQNPYLEPGSQQMAIVREIAALPAGSTIAADLPGDLYYRICYETVARLMGLPKPAWSTPAGATHLLHYDSADPLHRRPLLEPEPSTVK